MPETNRIEYKQELTADLEKEVVAFLNSRTGGVIHLGVDDKDNPVGIENTDSVQLKIKDRLKNNIKPSCMGLFDIAVERSEIWKWLSILVRVFQEYYEPILRNHFYLWIIF
jgi:predicted HTH transcriptional regulator